MKKVISAVFLVLGAISPAFAMDTTVVYKSGILVTIFLGICALIVVAQLVPALIMFLSFVKALFSGRRKEAPAAESTLDR